MINLFTTYYDEKFLPRDEELKRCLVNNLKLKSINNIYVLTDKIKNNFLLKNDINIIKSGLRPTFNDFFKVINSITKINDINIIANGDIYFDEEIDILNELDLNNICFSLTRWDVWKDGISRLTEQHNSQDTWIFFGTIKRISGNFCIGIPGCDNRLAYEISKSGYKIKNPSISIKSYHLHLTKDHLKISKWESGYERVGPPYKMIIPSTLIQGIFNNLPYLINNRSEFWDFLYSIKIKRWYNYKKEYEKYILVSFCQFHRFIKHFILYSYYRLPIIAILLIIFSPSYYKTYIKR